MMPQLVGLLTLTVATLVPLWTARAILGAILSLLSKNRSQG